MVVLAAIVDAVVVVDDGDAITLDLVDRISTDDAEDDEEDEDEDELGDADEDGNL